VLLSVATLLGLSCGSGRSRPRATPRAAAATNLDGRSPPLDPTRRAEPAREPPEPDVAAGSIGFRWNDEPGPLWRAAPLPTVPAPARRTARVELRIDGQVSELSASPAGALWLTTDEGHSYRGTGPDGDFQPGSLTCASQGSGRPAPCNRITFFTPQIAIATGYVGDRLDEYFRTTDAGATWERLRFGGARGWGQWIYDVFATERGEAWMGGSGGRLLHSTDAGRTFTELAAPFDDVTRLHRIFVDAAGRGLAGGLRNALAATTDGGRTWSPIQTPLDQSATSGAMPTSWGDDRIEAVALFGGTRLVQQGERVYAAPVAGGPWMPVAGGDLAFLAVDHEGRSAFGVTRDLRVVRLDLSLAATPVPRATLHAKPLGLVVHGAVLFALDESMGLYRIGPDGVTFSPPMTSGRSPATLELVRRAGDALWGLSAHGVYSSTDGGVSWDLAAPSEVRLAGLTARSRDQLLVWDERGRTRALDTRTGRWSAVRALGATLVRDVVTTGDHLIALGGDGQRSDAWLSPDRGVTWTLVDRWAGPMAVEAVVLPTGDVVLWTADGALRRATPLGAVGGPPRSSPGTIPELPCCTSLYFAEEDTGLLGGYVHYRGDHAWLVEDGGRTLRAIDRRLFPYVQVVPFAGGALAVVGHSFSNEPGDRTELHLLRGHGRRVLFRAPEAISDVSVDPDGHVLLELDPDPETFDDPTGKHWVELSAVP